MRTCRHQNSAVRDFHISVSGHESPGVRPADPTMHRTPREKRRLLGVRAAPLGHRERPVFFHHPHGRPRRSKRCRGLESQVKIWTKQILPKVISCCLIENPLRYEIKLHCFICCKLICA